jgi:phenylacetate-CoA ligase
VTECAHGALHCNLDTGVIELGDEGASILVPSFTTHGTPLIRYEIGGQIVFAHGGCSCGSCHPLVDKIDGRVVDYLEAASGARVSLSHLSDVIKGLPGSLRNVQFDQHERGAIIARLVVDPVSFDSSHEALIFASLKTRFGSDAKIAIEKVSSIERLPSGKYPLIAK